MLDKEPTLTFCNTPSTTVAISITDYHSDTCHQLGCPQTNGGHQHQTVGAQGFDPEAARAVPDHIPQGNVTVELALFNVTEQQEKAHEAPDAFVQEGGMHRQIRVNGHAALGRDCAAHQVSAGRFAEHAPRQGGVATKGLLIEEVAPAAIIYLLLVIFMKMLTKEEIYMIPFGTKIYSLLVKLKVYKEN